MLRKFVLRDVLVEDLRSKGSREATSIRAMDEIFARETR
jgi:hypothetical protein